MRDRKRALRRAEEGDRPAPPAGVPEETLDDSGDRVGWSDRIAAYEGHARDHRVPQERAFVHGQEGRLVGPKRERTERVRSPVAYEPTGDLPDPRAVARSEAPRGQQGDHD